MDGCIRKIKLKVGNVGAKTENEWNWRQWWQMTELFAESEEELQSGGFIS